MSRRLKSNLLRTVLVAVGAAAALPVAAQYYGGGYPAPYPYNVPPPPGPYGAYPPPFQEVRRLPARVIVERLEERGYEDIGRPRFTGTLYHVPAVAPTGARVLVTVDAVRGIVLNQVAVGSRGLDPDDDDDVVVDRPRRQGGQPGSYGSNEIREAPLRGGAASAVPAYPAPQSADRGSPLPADPRLAPGVGPRPDGRVASRGEPGRAVDGLNPDAGPAPRKPAQQQARRPDPPPAGSVDAAQPRPANPKAAAPKAPPSARPVAEAKPRPAGDAKPVRVIPGVTPLNGEGGSPTSPGNALDNLPTPPSAPPVLSD